MVPPLKRANPPLKYARNIYRPPVFVRGGRADEISACNSLLGRTGDGRYVTVDYNSVRAYGVWSETRDAEVDHNINRDETI